MQAFVIDKNSIEYKGEIYKALPFSEYLDPYTNYGEHIYVTERDVPVLLSDVFGKMLQKSDDGIFLTDYNKITVVYCREDKYEEVKKTIESGFESSGYCFSYYNYEKESTGYYVFTNNQNAAIEEVLELNNSTTLSTGVAPNYDYIIDLEIYSQNLNFRKNTISICILGKDTFLLDDTKTESVIYQIPEHLNTTFSEIIKEYKQSEYSYEYEY